jgi:hypothetical protein
MSPLDRKRLGVKTAEEMAKVWKAKTERDLQKQIVAYLRMRDIEVLWHGTHKKSTATRGWPDVTFCVRGPGGFPMPCAFEVKMDSGILSKEQSDMVNRLRTSPNAWNVRVIRSLIEVVDFLRELGL